MSKHVLVPYREETRLAPYARALKAAGLTCTYLRADKRIRTDTHAGLVLIGGTDVDPALYGAVRHSETDDPDTQRDELERSLLAHAMERNIPVLGICRGLQMLNVFHGGTLIQHLTPPERHKRNTGDYAEPVHSVDVVEGTLLRQILNDTQCPVNSRHHQAVERLGENLVVSARAEDGVIEAIERPDRQFVVAVQWHPEDQIISHPKQARLFQDFAQRVAGGRGV